MTSKKAVGCVALLACSNVVFAADGNCPARYDTASCNSFCRMWGDTWLCNIIPEPGNNDIVAVKGYKSLIASASGTVAAVIEIYSAWGTADGVDFCCAESSTILSPINDVVVLTGEGNDEIWFTATDANGDEKNLSSNRYQTTTLFWGEAWAGFGTDYIYGSNSTASDYIDFLAGEDGPDLVHGNAGDDYIIASETRGGLDATDNDGESLYGDAGRDEIQADLAAGETGTMFVKGDSGADLLCSNARGRSTVGDIKFWGDGGNDEIYGTSPATIDGGAGSDGCSTIGSNCERAYNANNFIRAPLYCTM